VYVVGTMVYSLISVYLVLYVTSLFFYMAVQQNAEKWLHIRKACGISCHKIADAIIIITVSRDLKHILREPFLK
jgi:hypothetical protein